MTTSKWIGIGVGALLWGGACTMGGNEDYDYCRVSQKECHLSYSVVSGYQRFCSNASRQCVAPQQTTEENQASGAAPSEGTAAGAVPPASAADTREPGAAPLPDEQRYSAFEIACSRDSQCGPGKCIDGACYYGCQSDAQCGSGDRCAVEQGARICMPDPNPPVRCTRSAQCGAAAVCLNGSCMQSCSTTDQCDNRVDRCASGICQPDRRPLGECVLSSECAAGFACLDGACVDACFATADGGVCLPAVGGGPASPPAEPVHAPEQPGTLPLADAGPLSSPVDAATVDPDSNETSGTVPAVPETPGTVPAVPETPADSEPDAGPSSELPEE